MVTRIDIHLQSGNVSVYWLWLLLDVSAVSVVIMITTICDMPKQKFSLCERVYIHNTYTKSRNSCSETRCKFRVKLPGWPVPNPSTIRRQAKRFKGTDSVKNRKVNHRQSFSYRRSIRWDWREKLNWNNRVSVWEQLQYADPLVGRPGSQGRKRQPSLATRSILEALYN